MEEREKNAINSRHFVPQQRPRAVHKLRSGQLYRLWYTLYKDCQIKMKTAAGLTCVKPTGENVTQGLIGGEILRSAYLDKTMCAYFGGSNTETR